MLHITRLSQPQCYSWWHSTVIGTTTTINTNELILVTTLLHLIVMKQGAPSKKTLVLKLSVVHIFQITLEYDGMKLPTLGNLQMMVQIILH